MFEKRFQIFPHSHGLDWTDDDLVAQCLVFFVAGFDTVSVAFSFLIHQLAICPEIQAKLYTEVQETRDKLNGQDLNYGSMTEMKYMDMVISESLRRWTPAIITERHVNKPYVMQATDGTSVQLNVGDGVWIPTYSIHMDAKYYDEPEKFDPERFNEENRKNIDQACYMPFGIGPRKTFRILQNCFVHFSFNV